MTNVHHADEGVNASADFLAVARRYRELHLFPVPLRGDKRPLLNRWPSSPWRQRAAVFACGSAKGIGIQCGLKRGDTGLSLVVLDFDVAENYAQWRESSATARKLADAAPTARTRRGFHVYFNVPGDVRGWYAELCEGKASGNYVVTPPTVHPSGQPYQWERSPLDFPVPVASLDSLPGHGQQSPSTPIQSRLSDHGEQEEGKKNENTWHPLQAFSHSGESEVELPDWIAAAIADHIPNGPGQRNNALFRLATSLVRGGIKVEALRAMSATIVATWYKRAEPAIRTKVPGVSLGDFRRGLDWIAAHWREATLGDDYELPSPSSVLAVADAYPIDVGGRSSTRDRIASILRALDLLHSGCAFALDGRTLSAMAGVARPPALRHVAKLIDDGYVVKTDPGKSGSKPGERWSARYHWTGPKIDGVLP